MRSYLKFEIASKNPLDGHIRASHAGKEFGIMLLYSPNNL
jgi:hypothetical protein